MKPFLDSDFLLQSETARLLYHQYAADLPILDYHCHINPQEIYEDRRFSNITQVWLGGDHYKWRFLRSCGVPEHYITGSADDMEKYLVWAKCLGKAIGNHLYHWSHLELKKYFGYPGFLNENTAEEVWDLCNRKLATPECSVRGLITASQVEVLCTTDDPVDSLEWHEKLAADNSFSVSVLPAWRPDCALAPEKATFSEYLEKLEAVSHCPISSYEDLKQALIRRMDYFAARGCCISDHGLSYVPYAPATSTEAEAIFQKGKQGLPLSSLEIAQYQTDLLLFLGQEYARRNWVMQLHFGVKRNSHSTMLKTLGPDSGFDCIGAQAPMDQLSDFLNGLAKEDALPKTILYSLNPHDNETIDTIIGCFQDASAVSKIQHGSAWWFNDHRTGMEAQLTSLANLGNLSGFVGMLTDSRSFLSYPRHEYFRRILCNLLGTWVENGEFPADYETLSEIVRGICYENAKAYFQF